VMPNYICAHTLCFRPCGLGCRVNTLSRKQVPMIRFPTVLPVAGFMQAAALEELGSRDAQLYLCQKSYRGSGHEG
jgi:hypothetical protein